MAISPVGVLRDLTQSLMRSVRPTNRLGSLMTSDVKPISGSINSISLSRERLTPEFLSALHLAHHALLGLYTTARAHGLEHLSHLAVLTEEVVDLLHAGAGAGGYAFAAAAVDEFVVVAFFVGHRVDDGFDAGELAL